jgi:uncharacterized membrane protein (UPF0127 family)
LIDIKTLVAATLVVAGFSALPVAAQDQAQGPLATTILRAGMFNIEAEIAGSAQQRQIGLMHRREMPAHHGMLFVFEEASPQCFWMRNTRLALSIAFVADDGTVVNVADMRPMDETSHCSAKPVRFALEMNQGWFTKHGLHAGSKLAGPPFAP